jgi:hypothetical protein
LNVLPVHSWAKTSKGRWAIIGLYGVVLTLLAAPIFSVLVPPLGDYAIHLARMHILAAYADSAALQANYVVAWKLAPYLAMDLIVPKLTQFMSIYTAGRVFLCICLLLFVLGTAAVHAALFRRLSFWPAASALFAYSYVFSLGFVNYLFGVGIWLLAFAAWIVLSRGPVRWRIAGGSVLSLAVFFSHFFAFFGYMLCVGGYELGVWLSARDRTPSDLLRRAAAAGGPFIFPGVIFVSAPKGQEAGFTQYGALSEKLTVLASPVLFPGARFDMAILVLAAAVLAGGLLLGRLYLAPTMRVPLILLGTASLAMPNWLSGVWGIDYRLPVVFVFLLIASFEWRNVRARVAIPLAGIMMALLAANVASIVSAWGPIGIQYDEFRAALQVIAPGARVIAFREDVGIDPSLRRGPLYLYAQLPALAVIERDAYLPFLFKIAMMPVGAVPALNAIDTPHGHPIVLSDLIEGADPVKGPAMLGAPDGMGRRNYWGDWPRHYSYAIELNYGARPALPSQLELLQSGQMFSIYLINQR